MSNTRTIIFSSVLGLVCAALLVAANVFTKPYRVANEKAEEVLNILGTLGVPTGERADAKALLDTFAANVRVEKRGELTFYEYVPGGGASDSAVAIAVPFAGAGLWGPIKGVLALENDLVTIRGIRFYQQEETPGLGGEIGSEQFEKLFGGKKIVSASGEPGFDIVRPGDPSGENSVNAITGATMTSDRVKTMLDNLAKEMSKARNAHGE